MSRRVIISILALLIIGVVGGTVVLIINRLRSGDQEQTAEQPGGGLPDSDGRQPVVDPTGDPDGDGLNNADERLWGTNPNNPDTDGDGFKDGEEVANGHNPTIAGPNDLLPPGFVPGRDIVPLEEAPSEAIAVDQFFVDNLDLSGPKENLTEKYQREFAVAERTPDTLLAFVDREPIVTQLPRPADRVIQLSSDTPIVMAEYMEVAGNLAIFSNRSIITEAINDVFQHEDSSGMRGLALTMRLHQERLIEQPVPPSAQNLHRLLLGYTELLAATYELVGTYNEDPVKATLAMRQLEEIDARYYPLIEREIDRLMATVSN